MNDRSNAVLRIWAVAAMAIVALLWMVPVDMAPRLNSLAVGSSFGGFIARLLVTTIILVVVLGFYFRMLWECGFAKDIRNRSAWLIVLILVPIVSAFAYFWVTRSEWYGSRGAGTRGGQA
ncbi:MAG: hypothetical protein ACLPQ6_03275 [Steroidobacteraceae bacterium]|jgi:hypothetical protein